ncbi:hypothetical protein [Baekduia alba]|uniref:hypothetical protein n=1 Tax=Baekduia alba TaxID=2997333 RepID=UPI002340FB28|nr:hypothetical protein [Baekduia alba]
MARDEQRRSSSGPSADWPDAPAVGVEPPQGRRAAIRTFRTSTAAVFVYLGLLTCLIAFGTPRESGEVSRPGFLILWYALPLIGTAAAVRLRPGGERRAGAPLVIAIISLAGWCAVLLLW